MKRLAQPVRAVSGVRGTQAHTPEIVGRGHDAASEMILPKAVDHHPRGQGDSPGRLGMRQAVSRRLRGIDRQLRGVPSGVRIPSGRTPTRAPFAWIVAALQQVNRRGLAGVVFHRVDRSPAAQAWMRRASPVPLPVWPSALPARRRSSPCRRRICCWIGSVVAFHAACACGVAITMSLMSDCAKNGLAAGR